MIVSKLSSIVQGLVGGVAEADQGSHASSVLQPRHVRVLVQPLGTLHCTVTVL